MILWCSGPSVSVSDTHGPPCVEVQSDDGITRSFREGTTSIKKMENLVVNMPIRVPRSTGGLSSRVLSAGLGPQLISLQHNLSYMTEFAV